MDSIRVGGNERWEKAHVDLIFTLVERLSRSVVKQSFGAAGLVYLPSVPTYNTTSRRLTMPVGTLAVDPDGNVVELRTALESEPVDAADVGTANIYLWCAVNLGTTNAAQLNRVRWVSAGTEQSFATYTEYQDSVSFVWATTQPPDTASGAVYFRVLKYGGWSGSPQSPTTMHPWWVVESWREHIGIGDSDGGTLTTLAKLVSTIASNIIGSADAWTEAAGASPHQYSLQSLHTRIGVLEAFKTVAVTSGKEGIPLTPLGGTGDWAWTDGYWWTIQAGETIRFPIAVPAGFAPDVVFVSAQADNASTVTATLKRRNAAGAVVTIGSASWTSSSSGVKSVGSIASAYAQDSYVFWVEVATGGSNSAGPNQVFNIYLTGNYPSS